MNMEITVKTQKVTAERIREGDMVVYGDWVRVVDSIGECSDGSIIIRLDEGGYASNIYRPHDELIILKRR